MAAKRPLRDWVYVLLVTMQLLGMLVLDLTAFYPAKVAAALAPLHALYLEHMQDPFFAPAEAAVAAAPPALSSAPWFHAFLGVEALVQLPLAAFIVYRALVPTSSSSAAAAAGVSPAGGPSPAWELAALAFGCVTAMGAVACSAELHALGEDVLAREARDGLLYGAYLPYVVVPGIMAVDMYMRLLTRLDASAVSANGKSKKL